MDIKYKIIDYIRRNRVSTTEVADCLGKSGALSGISALNRGHFVAGEIKYICALEDSNWNIHKNLEDLYKDNNDDYYRGIVFADAIDVGERALFGDIVSKYILLYNGELGIIANGLMRDAHYLIKENYPIWCKGVSPVGCFNREVDVNKYRDEIEQRKRIYNGAIAVCDDSGVVVVGHENITEEFYDKLEAIELQEDIWYDCIDRRKWTTYKTICLKAYLDEEESKNSYE